jgi:RNA polymerase sigma factor (sigma-70 family)
MCLEVLYIKKSVSNEEWFCNELFPHKEQLYRIAFSYLKNEQDSLEAIQAVTVKAFTHYKKLNNLEFFKTWLIRVLINYCIDELKHRKRYANINESADKVHLHEEDNAIYVRGFIERLEHKYRQVVHLKYFEDMTFEQISRVIKKSENTVKSRLYKAQQLLKEMMEKEGGIC